MAAVCEPELTLVTGEAVAPTVCDRESTKGCVCEQESTGSKGCVCEQESTARVVCEDESSATDTLVCEEESTDNIVCEPEFSEETDAIAVEGEETETVPTLLPASSELICDGVRRLGNSAWSLSCDKKHGMRILNGSKRANKTCHCWAFA
jgi:hypothetical protein